MPAHKKPTRLKILEGNRRKVAKADLSMDNEPQPIAGIPTDRELSMAARKVWDEVVPELDRMGLLTIIDGLSLEAACRGAAQGRWADDQMEKIQSIIERGKATPAHLYKLGMLNSLSRKAWTQWGNFSARYGLDPASRSKLTVDPAKQQDPLASAIFG